jgi:hypothetical protein
MHYGLRKAATCHSISYSNTSGYIWYGVPLTVLAAKPFHSRKTLIKLDNKTKSNLRYHTEVKQHSVRFQVLTAASMIMTVSREAESCYTLTTEAVRTSETLVNFYETAQCNIPENSRLQSLPCTNDTERRQAIESFAFLLWVQEIPGSTLGPHTFSEYFHGFPQFLQENHRIVP